MGKLRLSEKPQPPQQDWKTEETLAGTRIEEGVQTRARFKRRFKGQCKDSQLKTAWQGRRLAVQTIALYQRYLSPLKGFHCAHRRLHGGLSCSEYVKQTIAAQGIKRSLPLCRERFQACRAAHEILKAHSLRIQHLKNQALSSQNSPAQTLKAQSPKAQTLFGQSLEAIVLQNPVQDLRQKHREMIRMETGTPDGVEEEGDKLDPDIPAETLTQGEYYPEPDFNPPLPPPNPLASCLVCGAIEGCCGGPSMLGGMGCGDPLEGCSCCWDGFNLSACSCCL
jgi:putative component of membrane protein insertase Oxa1/YidC/SpoIIIJ protein YidD